jgi:soluble lytic murein transglycosylase-like protein
LDGIKIPVEAKLEGGDTEQQLAHFLQMFNAMGEAVAKANKLKFQPLDKASLDMVQKLQANFSSLLKVQAEFRKRLVATGQGNSDFFGVDWSKTHPDESARSRAMLKAFQYVTGGAFIAGQTGGPAPAPTPAPSNRPPAPGPAPAPAPSPGQAPSQLRKIANAGLGAAGGAGQVAAGALEEGSKFGLMAGLMGFAGGAAALGVSKLVGGVAGKVGNAQQELIGYDTLKRSLGDVNVSFRDLQESLRNTARELDTTFDESLRYGASFTRLANLTGEDSKHLGEEVGNAGGFGRSFGMDLGQSNAFFAQQRLFGVTRNAEDSRKLGLLIGEGLAKAHVFAKADEVLEAINAFTQSQTRQGMTTANVSGYASFLTGMMGSGIPGMDPASAAALLSRVNSAVAGGGNAGEAGQNFMFSALGLPLGLNPLQTMVLREQGAFGTGAKTFGKGSVYSRFMDDFGGPQAPAAARDSTSTNLQLLMDQFQRRYAGRPELMANAMSQLFGTSMSQSMALADVQHRFGSQKLGALGDRLQRLGVNLNDVNMTGLSRLGQLEATMPEGEEKDKAIREAATQNQEQTEGSKTRATINGVERAIQKAATMLVDPLNAIRAAVMYTAGENGKKSPREIMESVIKSESADRKRNIEGAFDDQIDQAQDALNKAAQSKLALSVRDRHAGHAEEQDPDRARKIADLEKQEAAAQERLTTLKQQKAAALEGESQRRSSELSQLWRASHDLSGSATSFQNPPLPNDKRYGAYDDLFIDAGREYGVAPALLKAVAIKESGLNPDAVGINRDKNGNEISRDMGLMQHNSRYMASRGITDWKDPKQQIFAAAKLLKERMAARGNPRDAVRDYNGSGEAAESYADSVMNIYKNTTVTGTPLPDVLSKNEAVRARALAAGDSKASVNVSGTFQLVGPDGQQRASPVQTYATVDLPKPAGSQ